MTIITPYISGVIVNKVKYQCAAFIQRYVLGNYICHQCSKPYKWKKNLNKHLNYECRKPPSFMCTYCERGFTQKYAMKRHIISMHRKADNGSTLDKFY